VSRRSSRPGPRSLVALGWLARVGAAPGEPLALVMNWTAPGLYDHVARLVAAGLVRRIAMTRGEGSLLVLTADGARMVGLSPAVAPRAVAPTTWAHVVACAWTAAWFEVRGRDWLSGRELAHDDGWAGQVVYQDGYGRTQRQRHRPDLATFIGAARLPVAVEVELQRKSPARLRGIMAMYVQRTADADAQLLSAADGGADQLAGVVYIAGSESISRALRDAAQASGLGEHPDGRLRVLALEDVIAQTREHAARTRAALRSSPTTGAPVGT
jgi:hypothetical protein